MSLYLEDIAVGQTFTSPPVTVTAADIKTFAASFDPQPFHLDEAAAAQTFFGGLAASGWHTAALTMRMLVASDMKLAGGLIGAGVDELKWPGPVRPNDELRVTCEVLEIRPSRTRPTQGIARVRMTTANQSGAVVQAMIANVVVQRRPQAAA